jgi:hypothetical protein
MKTFETQHTNDSVPTSTQVKQEKHKAQATQMSNSTTNLKSSKQEPNSNTAQMHCYGDSWFENLNTQRLQYEQQHPHQEAQPQKQATQAPHNYGATWFENLNDQRLQFEQLPHTHPESHSHNYGDSWFENLNTQRLQYEHGHPKHEDEVSSPAPHNYGDLWFESLNEQRLRFEAEEEDPEMPPLQRYPHHYGAEWFETYQQMWEQWLKARTEARPH